MKVNDPWETGDKLGKSRDCPSRLPEGNLQKGGTRKFEEMKLGVRECQGSWGSLDRLLEKRELHKENKVCKGSPVNVEFCTVSTCAHRETP